MRFWTVRRLAEPFSLLALIGLLVVALWLFGYAGTGELKNNETDAVIDPLDVVFVADFSGPDRLIGADLEQGFVDALARRGGSKLLKVVRRDDQGNPDVTMVLAEGAAAGFSTLAIVGPSQSRGFKEFAEVAEQGEVPVLVPVSPPDGKIPGKWVYTLQPSQALQAELAGKLLERLAPAKHVVFVSLKDAGTGYWVGLKSVFDSVAGATLSLEELDYATDKATIEILVKKLHSADLIFIDLPSAVSVPFVKALRDNGQKGRIVGFGEMALPGFAALFKEFPKEKLSPGYYSNGVLAVSVFSPDETNERSRKLIQTYHSLNGADPSWAYAYGYDVGEILLDFVETSASESDLKQGKPDPERWRSLLREHLNSLDISANPTWAFTGAVSFDDLRQRDSQPSLLVYKDRRLQPFALQYSHQPARVESNGLQAQSEIRASDRYFNIVPIVFAGIHFNSISKIDFDDGIYTADFDLWFRSTLKIDPDDIIFPGAVDGTVKGELIDAKEDKDENYEKIRFRGDFRFNATPQDLLLERVSLPLEWHHRSLDASQLRFVIDSSNFSSDTAGNIYQQVTRDDVILPSVGFRAFGSLIGVDDANIPALGDPRAKSGRMVFSDVVFKLDVESKSSSLAPMLARQIPSQYALIASFAALVLGVLTLKNRRKIPYAEMFILSFFCGALLLAEVALFGSSLLKTMPQRWLVVIRYIFAFGYYLAAAYLMNSVLWYLLRRNRSEQTVLGTIRLITSSLIYFGAFAAYYTNVLGRDFLPVLATSSVMLTVIGLALREAILDAIAGIALHLDNSIRIGEWISIKTRDIGIFGVVETLEWRVMRIRSRDGRIHFVPNSTIFQQVISNFSMNQGFTRIEIPFEASSSVELGEVIEWIGEALGAGLINDPNLQKDRPIQIICRKLDGDDAEMYVQLFYRAECSFDAITTKVLSVISDVLIQRKAMPVQNVALQK